MDATCIEFDILYKGEKRIESVKESTIVTMGLIRVGKTCLFNHILDKPMKGAKVDY
jgi:AAA+ ATPase superfamily predicted ATPase